MLFENQCGIIAPATQSAFRRDVNGQRASANPSFACQRVKGSPRSGSRSKNQAVSHGRHPAFQHFNSPVTHKWFISISPMFYPRPRWARVLSPTWHNASVTACVVISIAHKRLNSGVAPAKWKRLIYCHWFRHYAVDLQEIIALRGTRNSIKSATARNAECHNPIWYGIRRNILAACPWTLLTAPTNALLFSWGSCISGHDLCHRVLRRGLRVWFSEGARHRHRAQIFAHCLQEQWGYF